jgi:hypothetical protein
LSTHELNFGELEPLLELPALDLDEFKEGWITEPDFQPAGAEEQSRLDQKVQMECPQCGHRFLSR